MSEIGTGGAALCVRKVDRERKNERLGEPIDPPPELCFGVKFVRIVTSLFGVVRGTVKCSRPPYILLYPE